MPLCFPAVSRLSSKGSPWVRKGPKPWVQVWGLRCRGGHKTREEIPHPIAEVQLVIQMSPFSLKPKWTLPQKSTHSCLLNQKPYPQTSADTTAFCNRQYKLPFFYACVYTCAHVLAPQPSRWQWLQELWLYFPTWWGENRWTETVLRLRESVHWSVFIAFPNYEMLGVLCFLLKETEAWAKQMKKTKSPAQHGQSLALGICRTPEDPKVYQCSSPLYKMGLYLHTTYEHPPVHFNSCLDYL